MIEIVFEQNWHGHTAGEIWPMNEGAAKFLVDGSVARYQTSAELVAFDEALEKHESKPKKKRTRRAKKT